MSVTGEFLEQPDVDDIELTSVLHALSDPLRLGLVQQLYACDGERTCGSFQLPISKSTATHHWRVLREAGVVSAREEGTKKFHRLRRQDLDRRFPGLLDAVVSGPPPATP
ncbi:MAG TPA: helix-turn-helix domain-containing protein [Acidimicrobiales bacterium]|nr:helix-turn-helix domain-containing protein [Acidimicrobiales bacterium]